MKGNLTNRSSSTYNTAAAAAYKGTRTQREGAVDQSNGFESIKYDAATFNNFMNSALKEDNDSKSRAATVTQPSKTNT